MQRYQACSKCGRVYTDVGCLPGQAIDHHMSPVPTCLSLLIGTLTVFSKLYGVTLSDNVPSLPENVLPQWGWIGHVFCLLHPATLWGLRTGGAFWIRWEVGESSRAWREPSQGLAAVQAALHSLYKRRVMDLLHTAHRSTGTSLLLLVPESNTASICHTQVLRVGRREREGRLTWAGAFVFCVVLFNEE